VILIALIKLALVNKSGPCCTCHMYYIP